MLHKYIFADFALHTDFDIFQMYREVLYDFCNFKLIIIINAFINIFCFNV